MTTTTHKSDHFVIDRNYNDPERTQLHDAVYVSFKSPAAHRGGEAYDGISTQEAREAGQALIGLAAKLENEHAKREAAKIPEEPRGHLVIIKFPHLVPATRTQKDGKWYFLNGAPDPIQYTWAELIKYSGHTFEVLYTL